MQPFQFPPLSLQQPRYCIIAGQKVYVWVKKKEVEITISDTSNIYIVSQEAVESAKKVEEKIKEVIKERVKDSPR